EAAHDEVEARVREARPLRVENPVLDVAGAAGGTPRRLDHLRREVAREDASARAHPLAELEAELTRARRQLEDGLPGPGLRELEQARADRGGVLAQPLPSGLPAGRGLVPAREALRAVLVRIERHVRRKKNSPSRLRFRPPNRLTFRFRVRPLGWASTYSRPVLGATGNLDACGHAHKAAPRRKGRSLRAQRNPHFPRRGGGLGTTRGEPGAAGIRDFVT